MRSESSTRFLQRTMEGGSITSPLHSRKYSLESLERFPMDEGSVLRCLHLSRQSSSRDESSPRDSGRRANDLFATPEDPPRRNRLRLTKGKWKAREKTWFGLELSVCHDHAANTSYLLTFLIRKSRPAVLKFDRNQTNPAEKEEKRYDLEFFLTPTEALNIPYATLDNCARLTSMRL